MTIDDFPNLMISLGKARSDRVRNHTTNKVALGTSRTRWAANPHQEYLASLHGYSHNRKLEDILTGVVASDQSSATQVLSADRLFVLLSLNKRLSTDLIVATMALEERQARRYMAAAKLAITFITRAGIGCEATPQEQTIHDPTRYKDSN